MAIFSLDLSNEPGIDRIPPGKYLAELTELEDGVSTKGNPMLIWTWKVVSDECSGMTILSYTSLHPQGRRFLKNHLQAFGLGGVVELDTKKLIGKRACLQVGERTTIDRDSKQEEKIDCVISVHPTSTFQSIPF